MTPHERTPTTEPLAPGSARVKRSQLLMAMSQVCDLSEAKRLGHAQRVAWLSLQLIEALSLTSDVGLKADVAVAALLHDIGVSSVAYNLYERVREHERALLARYPSASDGLFGLPPNETLAEEDAVRFILSRHAEIGARMIQRLGYSARAAAFIEGHHTPSPEATPRSCLALADLLDTATSALPAPQRPAAAASLLSTLLAQETWPSPLLDAAARLIEAPDTWRTLDTNGALEQTLDACFEADPYAGAERLEAHLRQLAQIVDAQSPYMVGHTLEVTRLARRIGEHTGLEPEALENLYLAGLIHSTGRLGIDCSILEKAGGLSDDEFDTLYTYPDLTREALAPLSPLSSLVDAASTHREKLDGSGYPEGRYNADIPLIGRILSVADTFIALISDRPYRSGYSRTRALSIIQSESARLFDGLITDALEAVCREGL